MDRQQQSVQEKLHLQKQKILKQVSDGTRSITRALASSAVLLSFSLLLTKEFYACDETTEVRWFSQG